METKQKKRPASGSRSGQSGKQKPDRKPTKSAAANPPKRTSAPKSSGRKPAEKPRSAAATRPQKTETATRPQKAESVTRPKKTETVRRPRRAPGRSEPRQDVIAQPAPEVVYTPGKPFNRGRLLLQLLTVAAVVLALSFGVSIFFKVETVTVSGAEKYSAWTVKEASGIEIGDNLLSFGKAKAAGQIKTALPYVDTVRIGIKLPDTVNIEIKELDVVYCIRDKALQQWWLITSDGRVVEKVNSATAGYYAEIQGVELASPVVGEQAVAYEEQTTATDASGETTVITAVRGSDRLATALTILQYLEDCGIIGQVASVNVEDLGNLELWYGQRFRVKLGDTTQLLYKIKCMNAVINGDDELNSLKDYDSGVLDISFTIKTDQVIYEAFTE